eukprot:gene26944-32556_t
MLLQSIAYGMGITNNKLTRSGLLEDMYVKLELSCHDSQMLTAKRLYQSSKKRSECELSTCPKAKVKDLESNLSPLIRFWSAESITNLDNEKFMSYIDQGLADQGVVIAMQNAYHAWCKAHRELTELQDLRRHAEKSNLLADLESDLVELQDLEKTVESFVEQLDEFFLLDGNARSTSANPKSDIDNNALTNRHLKQGNMKWQDFQELIRIYFDNSNNLDATGSGTGFSGQRNTVMMSQAQWDIAFALLQQGKDFLKVYQQILQSYVYKHIEPVNRLASKQLGNINNSPTSVSEVIGVIDQLESDIVQLQKKLQSIDLLRLVSSSPFKDLNHGVLMIKSSLEQIEKAYEALSVILPSKPTLLSAIQGIEKKWTTLATKHAVSPSQIRSAYVQLQEKYNKLINFNDEYPQYQQREEDLRLQYIKAARILSSERFFHTNKLVKSMNDILPFLDMHDKCIYIDFQSAMHAALSSDESLIASDSRFGESIDSSLFSASGWDQVSLSLSKPANAVDSQFVHVQPLLIKNKHVAEYESTSLSDSEEIDGPDASVDKAGNVFKVLSSGEQARLALALELSLNTNNSILVLDEIDNHVGGEAVVKLADLLHLHAQQRQIIAVTHNVNVALKADKHIFVKKVQAEVKRTSASLKATSRKNEMPTSSVFELSTEEDRNDEVMRILGGAGNIKSLLGLLDSSNIAR